VLKRSKLILSLLLLVSIATACSSGHDAQEEHEEATVTAAETVRYDPQVRVVAESSHVQPEIPHMGPVLENNELRLYLNRDTAEIAILEKKSGQIWYSNPPDREEDTQASPYLKGKLSSQLSLVYLTRNGQSKDYDSYNDSVVYKQFEIEQTEQELKVTYHFGNPEHGLETIPQVLTTGRLEELLGRLEQAADKDELKSRYKLNKASGSWERREIPKAVVKRVIRLFEKMNYTAEDLQQDSQSQDGAADGEERNANPRFTAALTYRLDGGNLVASVDAAALEEDTKPFRIHSINLLENFGAAGKSEEGYMLIPDGSGALIPLNSGNKTAQAILIPLYGEDGALSVKEKVSRFEAARLPVFGIKTGDKALFAIIEQGDGLAKIGADIAGRQHSYNTVMSQFVVLPRDVVSLTKDDKLLRTPQCSFVTAF